MQQPDDSTSTILLLLPDSTSDAEDLNPTSTVLTIFAEDTIVSPQQDSSYGTRFVSHMNEELSPAEVNAYLSDSCEELQARIQQMSDDQPVTLTKSEKRRRRRAR